METSVHLESLADGISMENLAPQFDASALASAASAPAPAASTPASAEDPPSVSAAITLLPNNAETLAKRAQLLEQYIATLVVRMTALNIENVRGVVRKMGETFGKQTLILVEAITCCGVTHVFDIGEIVQGLREKGYAVSGGSISEEDKDCPLGSLACILRAYIVRVRDS